MNEKDETPIHHVSDFVLRINAGYHTACHISTNCIRVWWTSESKILRCHVDSPASPHVSCRKLMGCLDSLATTEDKLFGCC
jgi:hypothetical protein